MSQLFAALDAQGQIRFVGDVARGAACGCFCPACSSPLVAKLGEVNDWHFAHVAGQERPDCVVGAINLLRRLGVDYLNQLAHLDLPVYTERVVEGSSRRLSETVQWAVQPAGKLAWLTQDSSQEMPQAALALSTGIQAQIYVEVEKSAHVEPRFAPEVAVLGFWIPLAAAAQLRTREAALQHIAAAGQWRWRYHPDFNGVIKAARARLEGAARAFSARAADRQRIAGMRWAGIRRGAAHESLQGASEPPAAPYPLVAPGAAPKAARVLEWAKGRKDKSGFILYRLKSGEAWVIYQLDDGASALIPWPDRIDGWDEAMPASFASYDADLDALRITDITAAMVFLGARSKEIRNTYDPLQLLSL
ncbi:MAG: competence protein CoiA family protein [Burkholderiaceae bacterium]|jgi:hypothetical protein|nr:competence protein CoiA family protein [Burkholderiaceae bacterium]MDP3136761.1 competence protein CoiA family protein [Burkholderiaceae bacterium]